MMTISTAKIQSVGTAAEILGAGGIVAIPTETVYGLACDATNKAAVRRIYRIKGRPSDNPLIVHISKPAEIDQIAQINQPFVSALIDRFWPGPMTLVLKRKADFPDYVCADLDTVAVRCPDHDVFREIIEASGTPLAAPSANLSGRPSGTTWSAVLEDLEGTIDAVYLSDYVPLGIESTVIDCTTDVPVILRPGSLTVEEVRSVCPNLAMSAADSTLLRSPGTTHEHYAPSADVQLVDHPVAMTYGATAFIGLTHPEPSSGYALTMVCASIEEYAENLFSFFRRCDRLGIEVIHCEAVQPVRIGLALLDRIQRASTKSSPRQTDQRGQ